MARHMHLFQDHATLSYPDTALHPFNVLPTLQKPPLPPYLSFTSSYLESLQSH